MNQGFLKYGDSKIHFHRYGKGKDLLIALHGFADESSIFLALEESLKDQYTVYCIDLPFHGGTIWKQPYFDRADIKAIFKIILEKENKDRFNLMGFSLGGRIVLKSLLDWISLVDKVYLVAPDGLKTKGMFNANLIPNWFKMFLKRRLDKPEWLIKMAEKFYRWGIIDRFLNSFVKHHTRTPETRNRLFGVWRSLSDFLIHPRKIKLLLKDHPIPIEMYFGIDDKVIPISAGKRLSENMPNVRIHEVKENHRLVGQKLNALLKRQLQQRTS